MASDSTLIKAAFAEAQAKASGDAPDLTGVYTANRNIVQGYNNLVINVLDMYKKKKQVDQDDLDSQMEIFINKAELGLQSLYDLEEPMPDSFINEIEEEIFELQEQFELVNAIGKDDTREKERSRRVIMGRLNRIISGSTKVRGSLQTLFDRSKDINTRRVNPDILPHALKIIDIKNWNDESNLSYSFDENGQVLFTTVDEKTGVTVTLSMDDLNKHFPAKNIEFETTFYNNTKTQQEKGIRDAQNGTYDFDVAANRSDYISTLDNERFDDVANRKLDKLGNKSLYDALLDDIAIPTAVLDQMYVTINNEKVPLRSIPDFADLNVADSTGVADNVLDASDLTNFAQQIAASQGISLEQAMDTEQFKMFENNMDAMLDALTNSKNQAFNKDVSYNLLADYMIGSEDGSRPGIQQQIYDLAYQNITEEKARNEENDSLEVNGFTTPRGHRTMTHMDLKFSQFQRNDKYVVDEFANQWRNLGNNMYSTVIQVPDGKGGYTTQTVTLQKGELMRSQYFNMGEYLDYKHPNAYVTEKAKLSIDLNTEMSFNDGVADINRPVKDFIGKPKTFTKALQARYVDAADRIVFKSSTPEVIYIRAGNNQNYAFNISTEEGMQNLLNAIIKNNKIFYIKP